MRAWLPAPASSGPLRPLSGPLLPAALWVAIPAAPLAAGAAARALLGAAPGAIAVDLAQPLAVVTAWGHFGATLFALLASGMALSGLALATLCWRARRTGLTAGRGGLLVIAACTTLGLAAALCWPCVFSSDAYAYAAYGDQVLHGQNPYRPAPAGAHDAFLDAARWQWTRSSFPACVYGPLFVAASAAAVTLAGGTLPATLVILRLAACAGFLAAVFLLDAALAGFDHRRIRVAAFALNPVALWSAAEGHNDTFVLAAVIGAVLALRRGRPILAGMLVAATPLVKAVGFAAGPPLWALLRGTTRDRFTFAFALTAVGTAAIVLPWQLVALGTLAGHGRYAPQYSLQGAIGTAPALALAAAVGFAALGDLRRGRFAGVVRLALALWLAIPNPYPWYALWILPIAVAGPLTWESAALYGVTISIGLRYLPEAYGEMAGLPGALVTLGELLPAVLALVALRPAKAGPSQEKATPIR